MKIRALILNISILFIPQISWAVESAPYWEILLLGGTAALQQQSTTLEIFDSLPANKLEQYNQDDWKSWTLQAGLGYAMPLFDAERYSNQVQWLPTIQPQLNAYFLKGNMNGLSDQYYEYPGVGTDQDYRITLESTRVMFDVALTLVSWRNVALYGIAGIGPSWNRTSLLVKENSDCEYDFSLDKHTDTNFAYEFGGGVNYSFSKHLSVTAEYLYTGIQNIQFANSGNFKGIEAPTSNAADVKSNSFDVHSQAVLFGLRLAF